MRAGKVASLIVLAALVGLALAVSMAGHLLAGREVSLGWSMAIIGGGVCLVLAAVLLPCGWSLDRAMAALEQSMEQIGSDDLGDGGDASSAYSFFPGVLQTWLPTVGRAFAAVADRCHQREQMLKQQLRELEIRHRVTVAERRQVGHVLHALREPVIVTNAYHEIVMVNEAAAMLFGFAIENALHKPVASVIHDPQLCKLISDVRESASITDVRHVELSLGDAPRPPTSESGDAATVGYVGRRQSSARHGESPVETNGQQLRANNQKPPTVYDATFTCIADHKQAVCGVVTILRDLTRERELSQMKTDFVSKASHELRTPLSSIRAYIEMLVDGDFEQQLGHGESPRQPDDQQPPASLQDIYRILQDETERLARLIDNMLNISRIEAGIVQIDREVVDLKVLIDRAVHTLGPQAEEKHIVLSAKPSAVDLCVEGDEDMLYQVILNLLSNGIKYTPAGRSGQLSVDSCQPTADGEGTRSRVTISADTDNLTRSVVVSVSDTGLGIPPDALPHLFDKFYRVENYKRVAKGTGLGLSLCKHIVETVHQGQVGVESKLGMGSRFWFSVPMRYAGSQAA